MGQSDILNYLKKLPKNQSVTSKQISDNIDCNNNSIQKPLKVLRDNNEINYKLTHYYSKKCNQKINRYEYWYKK